MTGQGRLDLSTVFTLLSVARRRYLLYYLADRAGETVSVADVARHVADREETDASVEDVVVSVHHVHAPRLAQAGVLDYGEGTVTYSGRPPLERFLSLAREHDA